MFRQPQRLAARFASGMQSTLDAALHYTIQYPARAWGGSVSIIFMFMTACRSFLYSTCHADLLCNCVHAFQGQPGS